MSENNISAANSPRSFKWLMASALLLICVLFWWHERAANSVGPTQEQTNVSGNAASEIKTIQKPKIASVAFLNSYWNNWSVSLSEIQEESDIMRRDQKMQVWADSFLSTDIPFALQFLQEKEQSDLVCALEIRLVRRWAAKDAEAAAMWVKQMSQGPAQQDELKGVAIVWANQNPADAIKWALGLFDRSDQQNAIQAIAYETARSSPLDALMLVTNLPTGSEQDALIRYATTQWSTQDPGAAAQWAGQLQAGQLKDQLLADIATQWAEKDPSAAATLALQSVPVGKLQDDAVVEIVERWAERDPHQAANWVAQFPAGNLRNAAVDNLIALWTTQDWEAPATWLEGLPLGSLRDTALASFAGRVAPLSKTTAMAWIGQISDTTMREQATTQLGN